MPPTEDNERRVLLLAPTTRDGRITHSLLTTARVPCVVCDDLPMLNEEIRNGVGAILITDSVLAGEGVDELLGILSLQPPWSDIPLVMLVRGGNASTAAGRVVKAVTNVTLLDRPTAVRTLVSAVQAAIRARKRQLEIRNLLEREQAARVELERAGRMKDEFLATLSHELRTPLTAILGWSQIIRRTDADHAIVIEGIAVIEKNARVQVKLIEDLLDMSRIISGKVQLEMRMIEPTSFIMAAIETVMPAAELKGVRLETQLDPHAGDISGDAGRLQQVVWNVLSNAIKFTPKGGKIRVNSARVQSQVEITISDSGIGIKRDFLPHIFERFRQADASTTRSYGGLGLGLAIVKNLVELHGGTITAHSDGENEGSTFRIILPLAAVRMLPTGSALSTPMEPPRSVLYSHDSTTLTGLKVLVVDDEPDARHLVQRVLEDCDAKVITASSAREALGLMKTEHPDVLVSDIGMPLVDGYELLRNIRAHEAKHGGRVPAVALTAFARSEDRTKALLAGYLVHIAKPVEPNELVATVASVAGRTGTPA